MQLFRNLRPLLDWHMAAVVVLAVGGTFICRQIDLITDLPAEVISIAIIFPVVFSIAEAHSRREQALRNFSTIKACAISLYYAYRDWPLAPYDMTAEGAQLMRRMLRAVGDYFDGPAEDEPDRLRHVYSVFSDVSVSHRRLLNAGVNTSELSRASQFLRDAISEFEKMRNFDRYRTPITLRAFSRFFLTSFPVLFAPYFAYVGYPESHWLGYVFAAIYSAVLVCLDNIQEQLENPYDGIGPDDLHLDVLDQYERILNPAATPGWLTAAEEVRPTA